MPRQICSFCCCGRRFLHLCSFCGSLCCTLASQLHPSQIGSSTERSGSVTPRTAERLLAYHGIAFAFSQRLFVSMLILAHSAQEASPEHGALLHPIPGQATGPACVQHRARSPVHSDRNRQDRRAFRPCPLLCSQPGGICKCKEHIVPFFSISSSSP